jgi:hypothetical protein
MDSSVVAFPRSLQVSTIGDLQFVECRDSLTGSWYNIRLRVDGDKVILTNSRSPADSIEMDFNYLLEIILDGRETVFITRSESSGYIIYRPGNPDKHLEVTGPQIDAFRRTAARAFVQAMHIDGQTIPYSPDDEDATFAEVIADIADNGILPVHHLVKVA